MDSYLYLKLVLAKKKQKKWQAGTNLCHSWNVIYIRWKKSDKHIQFNLYY